MAAGSHRRRCSEGQRQQQRAVAGRNAVLLAGHQDSAELNDQPVLHPEADKPSWKLRHQLLVGRMGAVRRFELIFNQNQSLNSGFVVDVWRPHPFGVGIDALSQQPVSNVFNGVSVDVAARNSDAVIYRITYNTTLLGRIERRLARYSSSCVAADRRRNGDRYCNYNKRAEHILFPTLVLHSGPSD